MTLTDEYLSQPQHLTLEDYADIDSKWKHAPVRLRLIKDKLNKLGQSNLSKGLLVERARVPITSNILEGKILILKGLASNIK